MRVQILKAKLSSPNPPVLIVPADYSGYLRDFMVDNDTPFPIVTTSDHFRQTLVALICCKLLVWIVEG